MELEQKISTGARITPEEARRLFSWNLLELGAAADARRERAVPTDEVGFIVDRIINFTNLCEASCDFCAFHARGNVIEAYELSIDAILGKVAELIAAGGTQVMLQGGLHPEHTVETYVGLVNAVKGRFPDIYLHSFSPAEIIHVSKKSGITIDAVLTKLREAGLDSVPGASDLLVDRVRSLVSPRKTTVEEWRSVIRALARHGMKSSATMTYGMGESIDEKIDHLSVVRGIQDETAALRAFIPWSFSPARTNLSGALPATGIEYLRIVAVARIFLDNVDYIQAGWLTEGMKLAQVALAMGANDMGGVLMEEVVVKATGISTRTNADEMIRVIKNAGKVPVQRDSDYRVIRRFP